MTVETTRPRCARILLVEDHPLVRSAMRRMLSGRPEFTVCGEAGTLAEGRRLCRELTPDLVLLDASLPDGDGLGLLEESRGWADPPKVLILAADEADTAAVEGMRGGAVGFVSKQVGGSALLGIVRSICSGRNYMKQRAIGPAPAAASPRVAGRPR